MENGELITLEHKVLTLSNLEWKMKLRNHSQYLYGLMCLNHRSENLKDM